MKKQINDSIEEKNKLIAEKNMKFTEYVNKGREKTAALESEKEIFELNDEAKSFAKLAIKGVFEPEEQIHALVQHIFSRSDLNLLYRSDANTVANQTFQNKAANCLSMSIMTYALVKELGFAVRFQDIEIPEYWTIREGQSLLNRHINLQIIPKQKNQIHFEVSERKVLLRIMDIAMILLGIFALEYVFDFEYVTIDFEHPTYLLTLLGYYAIFATIFELYDLQKASRIDTTFKNIVVTVATTVLFYLLTPIIAPFLPEARLQILYLFMASVSFVFLGRLLYTTLIDSPRYYKRILIVGEVSTIENVVNALDTNDPNYKIIGFVNSESKKEDQITFTGLKEYEPEALINTINEEQVSEIIDASFNTEAITTEVHHDLMLLLERGFKIREFTQVYEELLNRVPIQFIGKDFYRYFPFSRSNENKLYMFFHRLFDVVISLVGLLISMVLLPLIILGNALGNKGPLFYSQVRIGKNSKPFRILKFRTMLVNAESDGIQWAQKNDLRITKFGNFLRRSRIDEFPQFYNVLKGEMSIIGPRPERPFFVNELSRIIPFYETRHIIKPGLTGWAQVKTRYGSSVNDSLSKLQYDLYYIKHRSVFLDLNIFIKTLSTVLYYRGQ